MEQPAMPKGLRFTILHRAIRRQMDEYVREAGLTGAQFGVLGALGRLEREGNGEVTQRALEEAAHVTHPTMTELLKKLERKGFVVCRTSEVDRRYKSVSSTEKNERLRRTLGELDERIYEELCRGLDPEQTEALLRITDVMLENAKRMNDAREPLPRGRGCESL